MKSLMLLPVSVYSSQVCPSLFIYGCQVSVVMCVCVCARVRLTMNFSVGVSQTESVRCSPATVNANALT